MTAGSDGMIAEVLRIPAAGPDTPVPSGESGSSARYVDVGAAMAGGAAGPRPSLGRRTDGEFLLYPAAVSVLFGAPESGKTLLALSLAAETVREGGSVLMLDLDHNGAQAIISKMMKFGIDLEVLEDRTRFRLAMPDDSPEVLAVIADAETWHPTLAVIDSVGELLPLFGADSNSADAFTLVNRQTLAALARQGSCVLAVDHEAKGVESRQYGAGGSVAKKRAVDGVMLRVSVRRQFRPGHGGMAALTIVKDRHGGVRQVCPAGEREPLAAMFEINPGDWLGAKLIAPTIQHSTTSQADVDHLLSLSPAPTSVRDVKTRMGWGTGRSSAAWREFGEIAPDGRVPPFLPKGGGTGEHSRSLFLGTPGNVPGTPCEIHGSPTFEGLCGRCEAEADDS